MFSVSLFEYVTRLSNLRLNNSLVRALFGHSITARFELFANRESNGKSRVTVRHSELSRHRYAQEIGVYQQRYPIIVGILNLLIQ